MSQLGRYFEDFNVGDVYQHRLGRTISEADNTWFTLLTLNTNQAHFNAQYAAATPYGRILVNSAFPNPIFVGDTIWAESIVTGKRESKSRPYAGIISVRTRALNQDGEVCLTFDRSALVYKGEATQTPHPFPSATTSLTLE